MICSLTTSCHHHLLSPLSVHSFSGTEDLLYTCTVWGPAVSKAEALLSEGCYSRTGVLQVWAPAKSRLPEAKYPESGHSASAMAQLGFEPKPV